MEDNVLSQSKIIIVNSHLRFNVSVFIFRSLASNYIYRKDIEKVLIFCWFSRWAKWSSCTIFKSFLNASYFQGANARQIWMRIMTLIQAGVFSWVCVRLVSKCLLQGVPQVKIIYRYFHNLTSVLRKWRVMILPIAWTFDLFILELRWYYLSLIIKSQLIV